MQVPQIFPSPSSRDVCVNIAQNNSKCREWLVRLVSREYANLSRSKKGHSLDSLIPSKGKYNNLDKRESGITEKSYEIFGPPYE